MKGYTRFSPNSIYIFVYNIELGLSLFGEGVVWGWLGLVWGVCMGFFCWGWLWVFICWVLVVAWLISFWIFARAVCGIYHKSQN